MSDALHYAVEVLDPHAHLWRVTFTVPEPADQTVVSLPVWIPGSYLVREFSRHVQGLRARQGRRQIAVTPLDKSHWQIGSRAGQALVLVYEVYAFDPSVRAAWLDAQRGFFNGTSLCLCVQGQEDRPHHLTLRAPGPAQRQWQVATGLQPLKVDRRGFGLYQAADYDELVDCPVEMGGFWSGEFKACGIAHRLVVSGALPSFDAERLLADTQRICETAIRFWHGPGPVRRKAPHTRYVFLLHVVQEGYGGLEHRNSTALICGRKDLPRVGQNSQSEGYTTLLGLISHEYFHTWNVKRLRPDAFARYDYSRENYTSLLWFFEGFTSYYDDLLLCRAGLINDAAYLRLLAKTINGVAQTPGRRLQSVAQASWDAWIKYYRPDENSLNATVSYYTKGSLVALCLDLALRREGHHLDELMRALWQRCAAGPMSEQDVLSALLDLTGRSWQAEVQAWVHGTEDLPLRDLLATQGVQVEAEPASVAEHLGIRHSDTAGGVLIKAVLRGSAAERAGLAAGDEWLGLEVGARAQGGAWRMGALEDLKLLLGRERRMTAIVSRDRRLMRLPLQMPEQASQWTLQRAEPPAGSWPEC